jgi:hypothetical protein
MKATARRKGHLVPWLRGKKEGSRGIRTNQKTDPRHPSAGNCPGRRSIGGADRKTSEATETFIAHLGNPEGKLIIPTVFKESGDLGSRDGLIIVGIVQRARGQAIINLPGQLAIDIHWPHVPGSSRHHFGRRPPLAQGIGIGSGGIINHLGSGHRRQHPDQHQTGNCFHHLGVFEVSALFLGKRTGTITGGLEKKPKKVEGGLRSS